jgi:predicted DCC family thiol-disulfide oxidoreductase YuxK
MPPILLYDGTCGFCAASVQLVLRHDPRGTLRFAPLQGVTGHRILARHPELAGVDSVVWVDDPDGPAEQVATRSTAALRVARYLGGAWHLLRLGWIVPRPMRDAVYDLIARHRHRIPFQADACALPAPEVRERFLDG